MAWAILCLAGYLLGLGHLLAVQHVSCPEHGELVDGVEADIGPAASAASATGDGVVRAGLPDEPGHHHCDVAPARRQQAALSRAAALCPLAAADRAGAWCSSAASSVPVIPLLSLAPKNSPPV